MAARTVLLNLVGNDRASRSLRRVRQEVTELGDRVERVGQQMRPATEALGRFTVAASRAFSTRGVQGFNQSLRGLGAGTRVGTKAVLGMGAASAGVFAGMGAGVAGLAAGIAGLGIALALQNDQLKKVFTDTFSEIKKQAVSLAAPFIGPLKQVAGIIKSTFGAIAPELKEAFATVAPALVPLAKGIGAMVENMSALFVPLAQVGAEILTGLGPALATFGQQMVAFFKPVLAALDQVGAGLFGTLITGIGNLLVALGPLIAVLIEVGSVMLGPLLSALTTIVGALASALAPVLRALAPVFNQLVGALAPLISQLVAGLSPILVALMPILSNIFTVLQPVISALISGLQPVIMALVPVVGLLVGALGKVITAIVPLLTPLGELIASLVTGLLPVLTPIITLLAETAATILGALVAALIECMPALQGIVLAVAELLPLFMPLIPLWGQLLLTIVPLIPALVQLVAMLVGYLVPVLRVVITVVVAVVGAVIQKLIPVLQWLVEKVIWAAGLIQPAFTWIGQAALWLWNNAIKPAWDFIVAAISKAWGFLKPIFDIIAMVLKVVVGGAFKVLQVIVKVVWILIAAAIKVAWGLIKVIFNAIMWVVEKVLAPVFRWLYDKVIRPVWNKISSVIEWVWEHGIKPAFDKVKEAVGKVRDAFSTAVDGIKRIWNKIKGIAKTPVNFVIGLYNEGIVDLVNGIANFAGVDTRLSKIPKFATGGILPGYSPGVDSLIAAVSPGEAIMRPEFTRAVGNGFVTKANDVARRSGVDGVRSWLTGPAAMGGEGLAFARGGVVPRFAGSFGFGGIIGGFLGGLKDWTISNVGGAAGKVIDTIMKAVPGKGMFRDVINAIPAWVKDQILKWVKGNVSSGGPGAERALSFARAQEGKPYVWGGVGPGGFDCSGFMSAILNVIQGKNPYSRRFTTFSFTGASNGPGGFVRGVRSPFTVGVTNAGVGHMAGTLMGHNVESSGSAGVRVDSGARGTGAGLFNMHYGLKFDRGGYLQPGFTLAHNATGKPEPVLTAGQFDALAGGASGGPLVTIGEVTVKEKADVDLLADRLGFTVRAATL